MICKGMTKPPYLTVPPVNIFLHMHKTGGHSLKRMLLYKYGGDYIIDKYENNPMVPTEKTKLARVIFGHEVWYGMHESINRDAYYITFLRNPYDRMVSYYYHHVIEWQRDKRPPLKIEDFWGQMQSMTMVAVVNNHRASSLKDAKAILEKYRFIGLQETFAVDVSQLLPYSSMFTLNVNETKAEKNETVLPTITEEQSARIRELVKEDEELYNYAVDLRSKGLNKGFVLE